MRRSSSRRNQKETFTYNDSDETDNFKNSKQDPSEDAQDSEDLDDDDEIGISRSKSDLSQEDESLTSKSPYEQILSHRVNDDGGREVYVKFRDKSYRHCQWLPVTELPQNMMKKYDKKFFYEPPNPPESPFNPDFLEPERIIDFDDSNGEKSYLVKWTSLEYDNCTWETDVSEYDEFIKKYEEVMGRVDERKNSNFKRPDPSSFKKMETSRIYKNEREIFDYQLEGVNWLLENWYNRRNCILADEMGLGKTIQAIALLDRLFTTEGLKGPFLIVAPKITIENWENELENWTNMYYVKYLGQPLSRKMIQQHEFFFNNDGDYKNPKFDVLLTSYEILCKDIDLFKNFKFKVFVCDEAHKLKNKESKTLKLVQQLQTDFRLLLTGTPLQNNIEELKSLLEFLVPGEFSYLHNDLTPDEINQLTIKLKKKHLILRRLKGDVNIKIAPIEETIIECSMTTYQKKFYKAVYERNFKFLREGAQMKTTSRELLNICIHPYLVKDGKELVRQECPQEELKDIAIRCSGKMILINKLLPKLQNEGHRVLIFSQRTDLLDIIQYDYLDEFGYKDMYLRIDGKVKYKQKFINEFNAPDCKKFIFLLSTRAAALGVNLNTADTVIMFDPDWNPQNDLQAQARCHRVGQSKTVKVYRLITKNSYEHEMFKNASRKLALSHTILDKKSSQTRKDEKERETLLKRGAYYIEDQDEEQFNEASIEQILESSKTTMIMNEATGSKFSKANFDADEESHVDINDPDFWEKFGTKHYPDAMTGDQGEDEGQLVGFSGIRTRKKKTNNNEFLTQEWDRKDRKNLVKLLKTYGWDRWECSPTVELDKDVVQVRLYARALLRYMLERLYYTNKESNPVLDVILNESLNKEFDPFYTNNEKAVDDDESRQDSMHLNSEEAQNDLKNNIAILAQRIEFFYFINMAVKNANCKYADIELSSNWTEDDKKLIYGIYKYGYGNYEQIWKDQELDFKMTDDQFQKSDLTARIKKIKNEIYRKYCGKDDDKDGKSIIRRPRPLTNSFKKRDKSAIFQQLLHGGIPIGDDLEYDWDKFREITDFPEKTNEQIKKFVFDIIEGKVNDRYDENKPEDGKQEGVTLEPPQETVAADGKEDEKETGDDKKKSKKEGDDEAGDSGCSRLKPRVESLTSLRVAIKKLTPEVFHEYVLAVPRWRNVPENWTNELEYKFLMEISERGWGVCDQILKEQPFVDALGTDLPRFMSKDNSVMNRVKNVISHINKIPLEKLQSDNANRPKKRPPPQTDRRPDIDLDENGMPKLPITFSASSAITDLGKIITDRPKFHTDKYIYPAGFKSKKPYKSTLDPNERVTYICEIVDTGSDEPLFKVYMEDNPEECFEGPSPTSPWSLISKKVNLLRQEEAANKTSISGPAFYCLDRPETIYALQLLPGAKELSEYKWREFSNDPPEPKKSKPQNNNSNNTSSPGAVQTPNPESSEATNHPQNVQQQIHQPVPSQPKVQLVTQQVPQQISGVNTVHPYPPFPQMGVNQRFPSAMVPSLNYNVLLPSTKPTNNQPGPN